VSKRDQTKSVFGQTFASPFGISPTGGAGLFRYHADLMLAEAARDANIPYIMSGASNDTIEAAAKIAPKNHWYQLYAARDPAVNADLIKRTADAGLGALVLTVDTPVGSKRERNIRNGFANIRWATGSPTLRRDRTLKRSTSTPVHCARSMPRLGAIWRPTENCFRAPSSSRV